MVSHLRLNDMRASASTPLFDLVLRSHAGRVLGAHKIGSSIDDEFHLANGSGYTAVIRNA